MDRRSWYPYPFLDPHGVGGDAEGAAYAVGIAVGALVFAWLIVTIGNRSAARWPRRRSGGCYTPPFGPGRRQVAFRDTSRRLVSTAANRSGRNPVIIRVFRTKVKPGTHKRYEALIRERVVPLILDA